MSSRSERPGSLLDVVPVLPVVVLERREDAVRDEGWRMTRWVWADLRAGHRLAARVRGARDRRRR